MRGGVQNLNGTENFNNRFAEDDDADDEDFTLNESTSALNTEVFKDGVQNIFAGGNASDVTLYDNATQEIYDTGHADNLTINHQAKSWLHVGAILDKDTNVNDFDSLYLYAGNDEVVIEVENLILNREDAKLYSTAVKDNGKKSQINIKNLKGSSRVVFTSSLLVRNYSQLTVGDPSGSLHFNVNLAKQLGDYLLIKKVGQVIMQ
ncbi:hypothetical protein [Bartonella taylorii]|uniref:hypothetical protein n=1 Tax=Bartonella taylorii TaxID=33046 RepID=UPI001FED8E31|nr:hypothetical protein [Bartonella taylorii]